MINSCIENEIDRAVSFIEGNGLKAVVKVSEFTKKGAACYASKGKTFSINIRGGVRPVSVWPFQGTVFSPSMKEKGGKGWKFKKSFSKKNLTFADSLDTAARVAKVGK